MTSVRIVGLLRAMAFLCGLCAGAGAVSAGELTPQPSADGGNDRLCINRDAATLKETFGGCRRGDIIVVAGLKASGVALVCDFGKTIQYSRGEPAACVYVGYVRAEVK